MATLTDISRDDVLAILDYCPVTGQFIWKERPVSDFVDGKRSAETVAKAWNGQCAGRVAGARDRHGYVNLRVKGRLYKAHRLAWLVETGEWPKGEIDHINGDTGDNRAFNLRVTNRYGNNQNTRMKRISRNGLKGVRWHARLGKWSAGIRSNGVRHYLGLYETKEAAHQAYVRAAERLNGEFARAG